MAYFLQRVENESDGTRPGRIMAGRPPPAPNPIISCEGSSPSRVANPSSPLSRLVNEGYMGVPTAPNQQGSRGVARWQDADTLEQMRAGYQQQNDPNYSEKLANKQYKNAPGGKSSLSLGWDDSPGSVAEPSRRGRGAGFWAPPQCHVALSQAEQNSDMVGCLPQGLSPHRESGSGSRPAHRSQSPGAFGPGVAGIRSSSRDAGARASYLGGGGAAAALTYQPSKAGTRTASPISGSVGDAARMGVCIGNAAYESRAPPANYRGCGGLPGMGR